MAHRIRKIGKIHFTKYWILPIVFAVAGFLNGFAGTGGGMVTAIALPYFLPREKTENAFAYTALAVLVLSLVSAVGYLYTGRLDIGNAAGAALPAAIGGMIGAYLLGVVDPTLTKKLFALLLIYSGVRFIWG